MSVDGREIATLDFPNLIGGPLNAIVEAQAKSAITTANFIKEVAFDDEGRAVHVDFKYDRRGPDGRVQENTLSVPFLTMLPIPYLKVETAEVEFNAKISSVRENSVASNFQGELGAELGGDMWAMRASIQAKAAHQKQSSSTEREQRSFDMRVLVKVGNTDMPPGTEYLLSMLENAIEERGGAIRSVNGSIEATDPGRKQITVSAVRGIESGWELRANGAALGRVEAVDLERRVLTLSEAPAATLVQGDTFEATPPTEPATTSGSTSSGF